MNYFPKQLELMKEFYEILHELTDLWHGVNLGRRDVQLIMGLLGMAGELSHHYGSRDYWETPVKRSRFKGSLKWLVCALSKTIAILKQDFNEIYGNHIWKLANFKEKLFIELDKLDGVNEQETK